MFRFRKNIFSFMLVFSFVLLVLALNTNTFVSSILNASKATKTEEECKAQITTRKEKIINSLKTSGIFLKKGYSKTVYLIAKILTKRSLITVSPLLVLSYLAYVRYFGSKVVLQTIKSGSTILI